METEDLRGVVQIPDNLSAEDQLSFIIGKIVRRENEAENSLRMIIHELAGDLASRVMIPASLARQIDQARELVKLSDLPAALAHDADSALKALRQVHELRNRVVHDWWVSREAEDSVSFANAAKGVVHVERPEIHWSIEDFCNCYLDLRFAAIRLSSFSWYLSFKDLPFRSESSDIHLRCHLEGVAGRIRMVGENEWEYSSADFSEELALQMELESARHAEKFRELRTELGEE